MRKVIIFIAACYTCIGAADAAVRDASSVSRNSVSQASNTIARSAVQNVTARTATTTSQSRAARASVPTPNNARTTNRSTAARAATVRVGNSARSTRATGATTSRGAPTTVMRGATQSARAAATISATQSKTFGTGYNACRDAYFTCMDQFCANQNEKYRRCTCSSRLPDIQARERALAQAADQIQDIKDLNIDAIPKTAAEVTAMVTASDGEIAAAGAKDKSSSAQQLAGISEVLNKTKSKSLSTAGQLDIAGDINAIWATTDLTSGANIANLTGESLYNAVHSQCASLVADSCTSQSTLNMVVSAYGMYIENDCTALSNALDKKKTQAAGVIRETEREMNNARLENYNAHNSSSINECIAKVRTNITADTACGKNYVHCLDVSGKYLNRDTGEPIYTADFYQLENQISLSDDVLTNQSNRTLVAELNRKRAFAERDLDTCRDLADEVWDEFMRQAIAEIYQGQQNRVRQVKNECLEVVTNCYDAQNASLKDFSNIKEQLLLGSRLELSEQLCREKLNACSNLYGGGSNGLAELITAMGHITDQKIAKECKTALLEYARDMCAVPQNDSLHAYPYACRVYAPGEQQYATQPACNQRLWSRDNYSQGILFPFIRDDNTLPDNPGEQIPVQDQTFARAVSSTSDDITGTGAGLGDPIGEKPTISDEGICITGNCDNTTSCGEDYAGSLYQKLVRYSMQVCIRPSIAEDPEAVLPTTVLADINTVMDSIHVNMKKALSKECDRLGGYWVDIQWKDAKINSNTATTYADTNNSSDGDGIHDDTGHTLYQYFYDETGANTKWGYCTEKSNDPTNTTTKKTDPEEEPEPDPDPEQNPVTP